MSNTANKKTILSFNSKTKLPTCFIHYDDKAHNLCNCTCLIMVLYSPRWTEDVQSTVDDTKKETNYLKVVIQCPSGYIVYVVQYCINI